VVSEDVAEAADEILMQAESRPTPCVVVVPFTKEAKGFAGEALGRVLKLATGIDILSQT